MCSGAHEQELADNSEDRKRSTFVNRTDSLNPDKLAADRLNVKK